MNRGSIFRVKCHFEFGESVISKLVKIGNCFGVQALTPKISRAIVAIRMFATASSFSICEPI
jgi:hypothetical protein